MSFDQMMIHYSAPTFCSIKPANLFSMGKDSFLEHSFAKWRKQLAAYQISALCLSRGRANVLIFVYNNSWLDKILSDSLVKTYLSKKSYSSLGREDFVKELVGRLEGEPAFPHETRLLS